MYFISFYLFTCNNLPNKIGKIGKSLTFYSIAVALFNLIPR